MNFLSRPKIKLQLSFSDKIFELIGWILLTALWIFTIVNYYTLPKTIPIHFDFSGNPDRYGDKSNMLVLAIIPTVLFFAMTILNKYPHIFNYPVKITPENAPRQYSLATRMIRYLKIIIVLIFGVISIQTTRNALGEINGIGTWILSLVITLSFIPVIYFSAQVFKKEK